MGLALEIDFPRTAAIPRGVDQEAADRHEMTNAATAVEGAATILAGDCLSAQARATLGRLLGSGVDRLRVLIDRRSPGVGPMSLAEVASEVAREPRWSGLVELSVAPGLVAVGSPGHLAEAVRQLLASKGELVSAGPPVLLGRREGDSVELWLQVGRRRLAPLHLPVAAFVAAGLMQGQSARIRMDTTAEGGPSIGICLPAAGEEPGAR